MLRRLQAQHGQRLNRRVAQLEGEIQVLQDQSRQLADAASQWQAEVRNLPFYNWLTMKTNQDVICYVSSFIKFIKCQRRTLP